MAPKWIISQQIWALLCFFGTPVSINHEVNLLVRSDISFVNVYFSSNRGNWCDARDKLSLSRNLYRSWWCRHTAIMYVTGPLLQGSSLASLFWFECNKDICVFSCISSNARVHHSWTIGICFVFRFSGIPTQPVYNRNLASAWLFKITELFPQVSIHMSNSALNQYKYSLPFSSTANIPPFPCWILCKGEFFIHFSIF